MLATMRWLLFLLSVPILPRGSLVGAHPGAIAHGRPTCGSEYATMDTSFLIPDIKEAWYLRRIATCSQPVFWTTFDVTDAGQKIYIAAISPELKRFQDKLVFNAIIYGPGVASSLPGLREVPEQLPSGIARISGLGPGAAYITSPSDLSTCAFVDTNAVMQDFSDVKDGRCMEELYLKKDYEDPMQADTTSWSWWLYSFDHTAAQPGRYYLQSWLTDAGSGAVAPGKYEITLGPWIWYVLITNECEHLMRCMDARDSLHASM
jgi:hypothetical protein